MDADTNTFEIAVQFVLEQEGGYVNDPDDPGDATNHGISLTFLRGIDGYEDADAETIRDLAMSDAKRIYKKHFWDKNKLGELPGDIAFIVFDTAVNTGNGTAVKILQESYNQIVATGRILKVDRIIGPITIDSVNSVSQGLLEQTYLFNRMAYYIRICEKHRKLRKFFFGWTKRVLKLWRAT